MQPEHSKNFPKTKTSSLFILVVVLNIAALLGLIFLFLVIRDKNEHAASVNNDLENALAQKSQIQLLEKTTGSMQDDIQKLNSFLVTKDNVVSFLERIDALGQATHCTTKVNTVEEIKDGQSAKIHLLVTATGSWTAVHTFLSALLNIPYKVDVKSVSLVSSLSDDTTNTKRMWTGIYDFTVLESK